MALRPSQPLTVTPHTSVSEASQIMAAKREDCVLVIDDEQRLSGIFTAKDLAFRVVGQGLDARDILIRDIMTENPICARQSSPASEALEIMVRRGFRHMVTPSVCMVYANCSLFWMRTGIFLEFWILRNAFMRLWKRYLLSSWQGLLLMGCSLNEHMPRQRNFMKLWKECKQNGAAQLLNPNKCFNTSLTSA
jgi:predicted transcriptional regulator